MTVATIAVGGVAASILDAALSRGAGAIMAVRPDSLDYRPKLARNSTKSSKHYNAPTYSGYEARTLKFLTFESSCPFCGMSGGVIRK